MDDTAVEQCAASISTLIKKGKYWGPNGAIAQAYALYGKHSDTLHVYRTALFSAIGRAKADMLRLAWPDAFFAPYRAYRCMTELLELGPIMREQAEEEGRTAEEGELLAAHLYGLSRIPYLSGYCEKRLNLYRAKAVGERADRAARRGEAKYPHTGALVAITLSSIAMDERDLKNAREYLWRAIDLEPTITDPMQLARVRKGIGDLYRRLGKRADAKVWWKKAEVTPNLPPDIAVKVGA